LLCATLIIAGCLGELALRVIDHPLAQAHVDYAAWYRPSEHFGHELVPGFEGFGPLNVPIKINVNGFRDGEHATERPSDVLRILGLGDSFLFGWGVSTDQVFLKQLERGLRDRSGRRIETINAGVPGWGFNQYYIYLKEMGRQFFPDLVVLAYFVDDLNGPLQDRIAPNQEYRGGLKYKGGLLHHSRLFNFLKSLGHLVREKNRPARVGYLHDLDLRRTEWSQRANYLMGQGNGNEMEQYVEILTNHIRRLKESTIAMKATLVVMLIPDISQLHHPEVQHINQVLLKLCNDLAIPFLDMTSTFEQSDDPGRFYLWPKDPHTNEQGHAEIAKALQNMICRPPLLAQLSC
jgi:lysophospholipase L1-like esterase